MVSFGKSTKLKLLLYLAIVFLFFLITNTEKVFSAFSISPDFENYYKNFFNVCFILISILLLFVEKTTIKVRKKFEKHYQNLINVSHDSIFIYQDQKIVFVNKLGMQMLGASDAKSILGKNLKAFFPPKYEQIISRRIKTAMETGELLPAQEIRMLSLDNKSLVVRIQETVMMFEDRPAIIITIKNLTKSKELEEKINHITYNDLLTNLPNREAFKNDLDSKIWASLVKKDLFAVLSLNMKRFKAINDSLGHSVGDILLKLITKRLKESAGQKTHIYRVGGDKFTIITPTVNKEFDIVTFCEKILKEFKYPFKVEEHDLRIILGIGVAVYPKHGTKSEELISHADIAMHYEKKQGNGLQIYDDFMKKEYLERLLIEEELPKALECNEFDLQYQPKVNTLDEKIIGVEALIRWNNSKIGFVPPLTFIPIAEEIGMIQSIGEWVLRTACQQAKKWEIETGKSVTIAVNVSPRQIEQENFVEMVAQILKETEFDGHSLQIEITETAIMNYIERVSQVLKELKELGIKIAIDDFGTGFSSLNYLSKLPIDVLKIDRSFVGNLELYDNQVIVKTIIALGISLHLEVIAEGVETEEQAAFLQANGCYQMQGYLFSKPAPAKDVSNLSARTETL